MKKQYLLPWLGMVLHKQGKTNACSVYAAIHALQLEQGIAGKQITYDPADIYRKVLLDRFGIYDPKRSVALVEVLQWLKKNNYIKTYMNCISYSGKKNAIQKIISNKKPLIATRTVITDGKITTSHALCLVGWDKEGILAVDSLGRYTGLRTVPATEISEMYCIYV